MKIKPITIILSVFVLFHFLCGAVQAEEISLRGTVKNIDMGHNMVVITNYDGKDIPISVEDEETLSKFRDRRIKVDDDVKIKYIIKDGKNLSAYFKRTAGCF